MRKVADGLLSGRYSRPDELAHRGGDAVSLAGTELAFQKGLRPVGFKALVGKGHPEFATMKQQDSEEFLTHLLEVLRRDAKKMGLSGKQPTQIFAFGMEQRLQCGDCKRVRYRVDKMDDVSISLPARERPEGGKKWEEVTLEMCLDALVAPEALEYACPSCDRNVIAIK
jgi:ubiquitin carboxyl-terminal hydrolase 5/13